MEYPSNGVAMPDSFEIFLGTSKNLYIAPQIVQGVTCCSSSSCFRCYGNYDLGREAFVTVLHALNWIDVQSNHFQNIELF